MQDQFEALGADKFFVQPGTGFLGPPGSGKTYSAETIARIWIGDPADDDEVGPLVKISGENFSERHEGAGLRGAPPGYIGYHDPSPLEQVGVFDEAHSPMAEIADLLDGWEEKNAKRIRDLATVIAVQETHLGNPPQEKINAWYNLLVEKMQEKAIEIYENISRTLRPFRSVLLIDEFEKMHRTVQRQFLSMLDKGVFQLHGGKTVDLRHTLFIFTSNLGTEKIIELLDTGGSKIGFQGSKSTQTKEELAQQIYTSVTRDVRRYLDPALYSRIGKSGMVIFHPLTRNEYSAILHAEVYKLQNQVSGRDARLPAIRLHLSDALRTFILDEADNPREGGRQISRLVDKNVREILAQYLAREQLRSGDEVLFDIEKGAGNQRSVILRRRKRTGQEIRHGAAATPSQTDDIPKSRDAEGEMEEFFRELAKRHAGAILKK